MDNINTLQPTPVSGDNTPSNQVIAKSWGSLRREDFTKGVGKGFSFFVKEYKNPASAIEHLNSLGKDGEAIVTGLINQALSAAARGKATQKIPGAQEDNADKAKELKEIAITRGEVILITEADAESYVPGTREKTSIPGLYKDYNSYKDEARKAKAAGNMEEYENLKSLALETMARITELMPKDDDLDNL